MSFGELVRDSLEFVTAARRLSKGDVPDWDSIDLTVIEAWTSSTSSSQSESGLITPSASTIRSRGHPLVHILACTRELASTLAISCWVTGNMLWAYGEVWDLRTTCLFGKVYDQWVAYSKIPLWGSCLVWILYLPFTLLGEFMQYRPWVLTRYRDERVRNLLIKLRDNDALSGQSVLAVLHAFGISPYEGELFGLPNVGAGLVALKTEAGFRRTIWVSGILSFRSFELSVMLFWTLKDLAWAYEDTAIGVYVWGVAGFLALQATYRIWTTLLVHQQDIGEFVYAFASFIWIGVNIFWGFGELYLEQGLEDDSLGYLSQYPECEDRIEALMPSLFCPPSQIPKGSWLFRWLSAWMLVGVFVMIGIYHITTFAQRKRGKSSINVINDVLA